MNFANVKDWTITEGSVKRVTDSLGNILWEKQGGHDYSQDYFFIEDISGEGTTVKLYRNHNYNDHTDQNPGFNPKFNIYKSTDQTNWTLITNNISAAGTTFTIPANGRVYLFAFTDNGYNGYDSDCHRDIYTYIRPQYPNVHVNVGGNIKSLLFGGNFKTSHLTYLNNYCFRYLLPSTVDASKLVLEDVTEGVYSYLFSGNSALVTLPQMLFTTAPRACCENMFYGCTSLTTVPELPATTVGEYAYKNMFKGCTSITSSPVLPATTLTESCYEGMFDGCTSLNNVTTYANNISAQSCLYNWLNNVAATGDFYNEGSATYPTNSPSGIPTGWTEHKTITNEYFYVEDVSGSPNTLSIVGKTGAPTINVYYSTDQTTWESMGITSTTPITATIPANGKLYLKANTTGWCNSSSQSKYNNIQTTGNCNIGGYINSLLYGDSFDMYDDLNGTENYKFGSLFRENTNLISAARLVTPHTLATGCYSNMFNGCTSLTTAPALPATTLANNCYQQMFYGCTSLTTAPVLQATTLAASCYNGMFKNCTALTTAPVLPATTLLRSSYASLFNGCSSLNSVTSYAQDISATTCTIIWLNGVSATGDFYNLGGATYASGDPSGIPSGWTEHNTL